MNPTLRMDAAIARFATAYMHGKGSSQIKMRDFMPWPIEESVPATPEQVLALLTSKVKKEP